jgi:hypothetical protein
MTRLVSDEYIERCRTKWRHRPYLTESSTLPLRNGLVAIVDGLGSKAAGRSKDPSKAIYSRLGIVHVLESLCHAIDFNDNALAADQEGIPIFGFLLTARAFSDSIILTVDPEYSNVKLLREAGWVFSELFWIGVDYGVLLRGVIASGQFYSQGTSILGPALNEAVEWYQRTDWAGIILGPSAAAEAESLNSGGGSAEIPDFLKVSVPIKKGGSSGTELTWALAWPRSGVNRRNELRKLFGQPPLAADVLRKRENTLSFFDSVVNH